MRLQQMLIYAAVLVLMIIAVKLFSAQIKFLIRLLINSLIGVAFLLIFNFLGAYTGVIIGVNIFTALITGLLGIPGFVMLLILKLFFV